MTALTDSVPPSTLATTRWHTPLLWLALAMLGLALACGVGMLVDDRTLLGVNVWEKPLKFAISTVVYAITWSWLIGQLQRGHRIAWWAGTASAILLVIELVIIAGAALFGITSHFNVATPVNIALWSIMAFSITTLWIATFLVSILLFRNPLGDQARTLAIRAGAVISLVGMGLAFLMTSPNAQQLDDFQGIAGAHTVGIADGGPGLPLLGWSTVAGDLRIPHFIGMHALQAIPLLLILIELASRRVSRLRDGEVRHRLVAIASVSYLAVLALLTWQALRGQSIVQPDATTIAITLVIAASALAAVVTALVAPTGDAGERAPSTP